MIGDLKKVIYYKVDGIEFRAIKQGYIFNIPIYLSRCYRKQSARL